MVEKFREKAISPTAYTYSLNDETNFLHFFQYLILICVFKMIINYITIHTGVDTGILEGSLGGECDVQRKYTTKAQACSRGIQPHLGHPAVSKGKTRVPLSSGRKPRTLSQYKAHGISSSQDAIMAKIWHLYPLQCGK